MVSILLVDDEPLIRDVLSRGLAFAGFEVCTAADGQAAWQLVCSLDVSVVVTDVQMPMMNGLELLKKMHVTRPSIPVIVMSGSLDAKGRADAIVHGAFDFLQKPLSCDVVVDAARRALCMDAVKREPLEARTRP